MFVDREQELAFHNRIATRQRPGPAQLILLYGRRRIGKTELLLYWSQQSGIPKTCWTVEEVLPGDKMPAIIDTPLHPHAFQAMRSPM